MQFSQLVLAATACAVASAAKFGMTPQQFVDVQVGQTFNISWYDGSGPATILLKNGPANILTTYETIASGQTGTSYQWTIPSTLPEDTYAFEIDDNTPTPNYSVQFVISGGPAVSSSSTSGSATSSTVSASTSGSTASLSTASSSSTSSGASTTSTGSSTTSTGSASSTTGSSSTGSASRSASRSSASTSASASPTVANVNSASGIASPLALVLLAFAAVITLN